MSLIVTSNTGVELKPAPIEASWIIEGKPFARNTSLSSSADGTAWTIVWDCTAGKFNWHYDIDETICILEGSAIIEADGLPAKSYGPGDVVFFRKGAHARWHVETYVRKIAFCRRTLPFPLAIAFKILSRLRRMRSSGLAPAGGSLATSS